jgi:membrane fusion protein, multidrug efflux system
MHTQQTARKISMFLVVTLAACVRSVAQDAVATDTDAPVPVRVAPVTDTVLARPIAATGTVAPKDQIALSFKVGGVVDRVLVDAGDYVGAGQRLAALDLREIDATLAKARSAADKAGRDLARARRLYGDSVVTLVQLQDTETAAEQARADLETAAFNRQYAVIVAPSAGNILHRLREPGETLSPGTTVLELGSATRGNVVQVGLADRDAVLVEKGDRATTQFDALPSQTFDGRISQIARVADPATGTYQIEITLINGEHLPAGLVGHVEIQPVRTMRTSLVPIESILEADGDQATVYALSNDGSRAERRRVTLAFIDGAFVGVTKGLDGITTVLTDGAAYVDDGALVRVTR